MVGEDSESGYQEETSEVADSESGLSDLESGNEGQGRMARSDASEGYSTNGESVGVLDDRDSEEDVCDEAIDAPESPDIRSKSAMSSGRMKSRLPRLRQPRSSSTTTRSSSQSN